MAEDLKGLIEKIQEEGVQTAENKAKDIENEAKLRAQAIVDKAEKNAEKIIAEAKDEAARIEKSGDASLKQAGRNLIISLRREIESTLNRIIMLEAREELSPELMAKIIIALIKDYKAKENADIIVSLGKEDMKKMEKGFLKKLESELKKDITLKTGDDIRAGFVISYDSGKSHYDFTDKALAEYISLYLRPKLKDILRSH